MDEIQIANKLKQTLPTPTEPTPIAPAPAAYDDSAAPYELDELTQYKLHEFLGEPYSPAETDTVERVRQIHQTITELYDVKDYIEVVSTIRELCRIIGITNSDQRIFKLHKWLKLETIRRRTEQEMVLVNG